jgi:hypothetical protein
VWLGLVRTRRWFSASWARFGGDDDGPVRASDRPQPLGHCQAGPARGAPRGHQRNSVPKLQSPRAREVVSDLGALVDPPVGIEPTTFSLRGGTTASPRLSTSGFGNTTARTAREIPHEYPSFRATVDATTADHRGTTLHQRLTVSSQSCVGGRASRSSPSNLARSSPWPAHCHAPAWTTRASRLPLTRGVVASMHGHYPAELPYDVHYADSPRKWRSAQPSTTAHYVPRPRLWRSAAAVSDCAAKVAKSTNHNLSSQLTPLVSSRCQKERRRARPRGRATAQNFLRAPARRTPILVSARTVHKHRIEPVSTDCCSRSCTPVSAYSDLDAVGRIPAYRERVNPSSVIAAPWSVPDTEQRSASCPNSTRQSASRSVSIASTDRSTPL